MPDVPTAAAAAAATAATMPASSLNVLATLLLCGLMGVLGQGIRATVGLKSLSALPEQGAASQQSTFSAAYFCLSLMIGFIAGVLAGIAVGLNSLLTIDVNNLKTLLGIAVAGCAGADFIENTLSIVIPGTSAPQRDTASSLSAQDAKIATLTASTQVLTNSVSTLSSVVVRGGGLIQLTGRNDYASFGQTVGMSAEQAAASCATPAGAALSGCWYLASKGCLPYADAWNIDEITYLVNGKAMLGRAQRMTYSNAMLAALGGNQIAAA